MKDDKHIYTLELTEEQAKVLSYACDRLARIICGQDWTYQEFMEEAWEKRAKKATGNFMDKEFEGGWHNMRADAEEYSKQIKRRFWGLEPNAMHGIHYDDYADILFDIYHVIRRQLWKDRKGEKSSITVDAFPATQVSNEPLAIIKRKEQ